MTPERMAAIHAAAFADRGQVWTEVELASLLERPTTDVVTKDDAGFVLLQVLAPEAEILTLAVDPASQGKGLGTALVQLAAARATDRGCETLFLEVAEDNDAARALYAKTGFTETGRRKGYYARPGGPAADALILSRGLVAEKTGTASKS